MRSRAIRAALHSARRAAAASPAAAVHAARRAAAAVAVGGASQALTLQRMAMNVSTSRTPAILTCRHAVVCAFALMALASLPDAGAPAAAAQKAAPQKPASQNAAAPKSVAARTFATPEEAAKALVDTVRKGDVGALLAIFGPDGQALLESS